jgi:hypothetical protein
MHFAQQSISKPTKGTVDPNTPGLHVNPARFAAP